ncbi:MAG: riboflavin synthase [Alphaproteobacteria bacterium]|nr:MAG: riboflavin synthase [Alphaproteobacteria bacterium]
MFTGLVQEIGVVRSVKKTRGDLRVEVGTRLNLSAVQVGASICCSGCCLTVVSKTENSFSVDVSSETLSKTIIGAWQVKTRINLEPSLKVGDEMGGHFVSGHVDATTEIMKITEEGGSYRLKIAVPPELKIFIAAKGSVTLDGISLTVNDVDDTSFNVNIIPHTWAKTTLSDRRVGDEVNIEIDLLARYAVNMLNKKDTV